MPDVPYYPDGSIDAWRSMTEPEIYAPMLSGFALTGPIALRRIG